MCIKRHLLRDEKDAKNRKTIHFFEQQTKPKTTQRNRVHSDGENNVAHSYFVWLCFQFEQHKRFAVYVSARMMGFTPLLCYICIHFLLFGSKISAEFTSFNSLQFSFPQTDQKPSSSVLPRLRCNSQNTVTTTKKSSTIYFCSEFLVWLPIELNSIHVKQIKQKKKAGSPILDYVQQ